MLNNYVVNKLIIVVTRVCFLFNAFNIKKHKIIIQMTLDHRELNENSLISHFPFISFFIRLRVCCPHEMIYNVEK